MALNDRLGERLATLTVMAPLRDAAAARAEIEGWPVREESPFAAVEGTHFARFVVVERLERQVAAQPPDDLATPYLVFSAFFDAPAGPWLDRLRRGMGERLDAAFAHCDGYPGAASASLPAWIEDHRVPATAIFGAYPDASLDEIRSALAFRERFREFAFALEAARTGKAQFERFAAAERDA